MTILLGTIYVALKLDEGAFFLEKNARIARQNYPISALVSEQPSHHDLPHTSLLGSIFSLCDLLSDRLTVRQVNPGDA